MLYNSTGEIDRVIDNTHLRCGHEDVKDVASSSRLNMNTRESRRCYVASRPDPHSDQLRFSRREATRRIEETGSRIGNVLAGNAGQWCSCSPFGMWRRENEGRHGAKSVPNASENEKRRSICIHREIRVLKFLLGACSRTRPRVYSLTWRDRRGF